MSKYTFRSMTVANTVSGDYVFIPDIVAGNQRVYDGKTFPIMRKNGTKARAMLVGDKYGLHTSGTGDPVVRMV